MVVFEEKVISFREENEAAKQVFVKGSDEHLDILLDLKKRLDDLTKSFNTFMEDIIPAANVLTEQQVKSAGIPSLLDLYASSISLVATLKRSRLAIDLKASCQAYYSQVENLRELIHDLESHRANENDVLDEILAEINDF
ncbi:MAG: hypothetical protein GXC78_16515 [Chitinophagaceae bacterium]|nr:hypothetical protein [Chitinophagaceae bacterium]